jgi:hypothetical protein
VFKRENGRISEKSAQRGKNGYAEEWPVPRENPMPSLQLGISVQQGRFDDT